MNEKLKKIIRKICILTIIDILNYCKFILIILIIFIKMNLRKFFEVTHRYRSISLDKINKNQLK